MGWSGTHSHYSAQFTSLITPNISIERPDAHLADGPTQDAAMAKHTPCLRDFTEVHGYRPNIPGVSLKPELQVLTAPLVYNTQSGLSAREATFRAIDLGEVALRSRAG